MPVNRLLCALGALALGSAACGSRPPLPLPVQPLMATPDAPFRAEPPLLAAADEEPVETDAIQTATLPNGLALWVMTRRTLPYVALSLVTRGAGYLSSPCTPEVMQLTARAVVEGGTMWLNGQHIEPPRILGRGVSHGVGVGHTRFWLPVLRGGLASAIAVLARTLQYPAFLHGAELSLVRLAEMKDLQHHSSSREALLLRLAAAGMYGPELSARVVPSQIEAVRSAKLEDLQRCYQQSFVPGQTVLIAAGDVTLDELRALAEPAFGGWKSGQQAAPRAAPEPHNESKGLRFHWLPSGENPQADVLLLQAAPNSRSQEDQLPFELLSHIAVGSFRSRSNTKLRHEAGVTYGVQPTLIRAPDLGLLAVSAAFELDDVRSAVTGILATLSELRDKPVSETELAEAKQAALDAYEHRATGNVALAALAAELFATGRSPEWLSSLPSAVQAISAADLQRVARKYLNPSDLEVGVVGYALGNELSFMGQMEVYHASLE